MISKLLISTSIKYFFFKLFQCKILSVKINNYKIKFLISNKKTFDRALYYYEKETLEWINTFHKKDIFWDIGSCTGVYSIYASMEKKCFVYAFEPLILNFNLTFENMKLNNVLDHCSVFNLYLGDKDYVDEIFIKENITGVSQQLNIKNENFTRQGVLKHSIDHLIENLGFKVPNHIKIDVERTELQLINGCKKTLAKKELKSIAIECHKEFYYDINKELVKNNFILKKKVRQSETDSILYYYKVN
jgi:FkbM family methyltransferase